MNRFAYFSPPDLTEGFLFHLQAAAETWAIMLSRRSKALLVDVGFGGELIT
jgi:hypothetical protein